MTEIAATGRLRLRPLQADDLRAFVACRSHPDVARYQWTTMRVYAMLEREWRAGGRSFAERPAGIR